MARPATVGITYIFCERELTFMFAICRRPSVCRLSVVCLSVTFVRPTQTIEIFGNVSMPFGTLAIYDLTVKILWRSSRVNPSVGGVKQRGAAKYSDFGPIERYIIIIIIIYRFLKRHKSLGHRGAGGVSIRRTVGIGKS